MNGKTGPHRPGDLVAKLHKLGSPKGARGQVHRIGGADLVGRETLRHVVFEIMGLQLNSDHLAALCSTILDELFQQLCVTGF